MVTYTLKKTVSHNGKTYSELTFREPTTGDLMTADQFKGQLSQTVALLASISEVPLPAFKLITARDLNAIMDVTGELVGNEATGTTGD